MANYAIKANPQIRPLGPVTPKDVEDITQCFARGLGVRDAARELGLSQAQVTAAKSKHGLVSGLVDPKTNPAQATEAFATKARRNRLQRYEQITKIVDLASEKLIRGFEQKEWATVLRGVQGIESVEIVEDIPSRDLREYVTAIAQGHLSAAKIEDKEDDGGQTRAMSMLEQFVEAAKMVNGQHLGAPREGLIQK